MHQRLRGILAGLSLTAVATCVLLGRLHAQAGSPAPGAGTLRVVATSPNGPVTGTVTQATIRFSEPMVALGAADADRVTFVTVTPAVPVRYHWPDTNVLVITPASGRFRVLPAAGSRRSIAAIRRW